MRSSVPRDRGNGKRPEVRIDAPEHASLEPDDQSNAHSLGVEATVGGRRSGAAIEADRVDRKVMVRVRTVLPFRVHRVAFGSLRKVVAIADADLVGLAVGNVAVESQAVELDIAPARIAQRYRMRSRLVRSGHVVVLDLRLDANEIGLVLELFVDRGHGEGIEE